MEDSVATSLDENPGEEPRNQQQVWIMSFVCLLPNDITWHVPLSCSDH